MTENMANGYSSDRIQRELSNENQHDRVKMTFMIYCFFVHLMKVTSAADGLSKQFDYHLPTVINN